MNTKSLLTLTAVALIAGATACSSQKPEIKPATPVEKPATAQMISKIAEKPMVAALPKAIIYRTSGNYINNVPVTTNADATALVTYPAPTDITPYSKPIPLANGYLLDRRGIGPNTFFTKYTYAEYSKLKEVPTQEQLLKSILPGAYVTEIVQLPMTANAAATDTTMVNRIIREGLHDCKIVWTVPALNL